MTFTRINSDTRYDFNAVVMDFPSTAEVCYSAGVDHVSPPSSIRRMIFDKHTRQWSSDIEAVPAGGFSQRGIGGGVIGSTRYLFLSEYDGTNFHERYMLTSSDGVTYGNRVNLPSPLARHNNYGPLIPTDDANTFFQGWFQHANGVDWRLEHTYTTDGGATWGERTAVSGTGQKVKEAAYVWAGGRHLAIVGNHDGGIYQFQSPDGLGQNWTFAGSMNLGVGSGTSICSLVMLDADWVSLVYHDRNAGQTRRSVVQLNTVWDNPSAWPTPTTLHIHPASPLDGLGYPAQVLAPGSVLTLFSEENNAQTDADLMFDFVDNPRALGSHSDPAAGTMVLPGTPVQRFFTAASEPEPPPLVAVPDVAGQLLSQTDSDWAAAPVGDDGIFEA